MSENWEEFTRDLNELSRELRQALAETMEEEKKDVEKGLVLEFLKKLGIKHGLTEYNRRVVINAVRKEECKGYPIERGVYSPDLGMLRRKKDFVNFLNKYNIKFEGRANVILFRGEPVAVSPGHLILELDGNERVGLIRPENTDYYNFVYVRGETEQTYTGLKGVAPKYLNGYFVLVFENK